MVYGKYEDEKYRDSGMAHIGRGKKQLIVKFNEELSGMERIAYLSCIGQNFMTEVATEDAKEGGKSGFGNLMDMMQLREWRKEDEETIRDGIPHDIGEEEKSWN